MKLTMRGLYSVGCLLALTLVTTVLASPTRSCQSRSLFGRKPGDYMIERNDNGLQTIVTWDEHSLLLNGERLMIFSGEVHPWRLPVTALWLDVFEKIKALGFNTVSFYVHWGLVEYKKGDFNFDGIRSYTPFFEAARKSGIYLIARPGPYINAETSGGGFPGWGTRVKGAWRSENGTYLEAMREYVRVIGEIIAPEQITEGGPVILFQPENEFSVGVDIPWPQPRYMEILQDWYRDTGIVVPMISNDVWGGFANYVPGSGEGQTDIYGYDGYPQGFDCANPYTWLDNKLPTDFYETHMRVSPESPNSILEFQGGAFDPWGGPGYEACSILLNHEFERVFYKNKMSFSTTIFNVYMTFGGTNWGGIAYPGVYTSYDYGSVISETRRIHREKYSELKLEANFLKVSPAYLTTQPQNLIPTNTINGSFTNNIDIAVTENKDIVGDKTAFWIVRHAAYNTLKTSSYKLNVPTSLGSLSIPQLWGSLTLDGRDSKIHVTDYQFGDKTILYSSGEIFTWKKFGSKHVLVLYGASSETHETAFKYKGKAPTIKIANEKIITKSQAKDGVLILNYVTTGQTVVEIGNDLLVFLLDRNTAYRFWVPDVPAAKALPGPAFSTKDSVIIKGTYLIRSVDIDGSTLKIKGDINATETIEIIAGENIKKVKFNGDDVKVEKSSYGTLLGNLVYTKPNVALPTLSKLEWKYADSLPEIGSEYDDSKWTKADKKDTTNPRALTTPTNLYSSEYGYHTGNMLWRGRFTATGKETSFNTTLTGGNAFGFSVWLNSDLLGSWYGYDAGSTGSRTFTFPALKKGSTYIITILQDHQGLNGDWTAGSDEFKIPRGILYYDFKGSPETTVAWKLTGNLGGETYIDRTRGPLNEGGLYAERQGWHYPGFNTGKWAKGTPYEGLKTAGVGFYLTEFDLNLPKGFDIPLVFKFTNSTETPNFRAQIYVNGYQFGKYANNVGPQTEFPVPEGIINHQGRNTLGVSLWAMDKPGAKLEGLELVATGFTQSGFGRVEASEQPRWKERKGAY